MSYPNIERSEILIFQQGDTSIHYTQDNLKALDNFKGGWGGRGRFFILASIFFLLLFYLVNKLLLNRENIYVTVQFEL